jgi:8-amino-7-oxononanoate synthase
VLDFTSALYLGLKHPSESLRPWRQLTTGVPAALDEPAEAAETAAELADLIGCEDAVLATSTLHLVWDLFGIFAQEPITIFMDAGVYPIIRWGVAHAAIRGVRVRKFPHHNAYALHQRLRAAAAGASSGARAPRPIIVTDGFCPHCGRFAPIRDYLDDARAFGGRLVIDDTQSLGVFGDRPCPGAPYGRGGGGSLRCHDIASRDILAFSSLAKGFGVPVAVLAGSREQVQRFQSKSQTRVHCSPPSLAVIRAAQHALTLNQRCGDLLRCWLGQLVRRFRSRLAERGLSAVGDVFPVQTLTAVSGDAAAALHWRLGQRGLQTVLHRAHNNQEPRVSFLLTARHQPENIDRAAWILANVAESTAESGRIEARL